MHLITSINSPTNYVRPDNEAHTAYPKFVHFSDGRSPQIVESAQEEADVLGAVIPDAISVADAAATVPTGFPTLNGAVTEQAATVQLSDRDSLVAQAAERNVKIDKRWGTEKIKAALDAA